MELRKLKQLRVPAVGMGTYKTFDVTSASDIEARALGQLKPLASITHAGYYALREASRQAFSEMLSQGLELKGDMQNGL